MGHKQMGPVDVNGGVYTARKQHQRKNIQICGCVVSRVLCGLGLTVRMWATFESEDLGSREPEHIDA